MHYLIYKITNLLNNKIYIGKHIIKNKDDNYMGSGVLIRKAINKYGVEHFKKEILFECQSIDEMNNKEAELVNADFIHREDTYNINVGGDGGWSYVNENSKNTGGNWKNIAYNIRKVIERTGINPAANALRLKRKDSDYCNKVNKKISESLKKRIAEHGAVWSGRKHSEDTKIKMSEIAKKRPMNLKSPSFGKRWVYNILTKENKLIDKNLPLEEGWIEGRIIDTKLKREKDELINQIKLFNPNTKLNSSSSMKRIKMILEKYKNNSKTP